MKHSYKTERVCPIQIDIEVEDDRIKELVFFGGGCQGNLNALKKLIIGMEVDQVIDLFSDHQCGKRGTSCMDQLTKALKEVKIDNK